MKLLSAAVMALFLALTSFNGIAHAQETKNQTDVPQNTKVETVPVPVQSVVLFSPANTRISFVGIHVGDDPKPRLGGFAEFQGHAIVDPANNAINSIAIDIKVDSVWSQFKKLTGHLKNADFFDTAKFPSARFVSSEIKMGDNGECIVAGNLTLHGQTKPVKFAAKYQFKAGGLLLNGDFQLDRSQFGMNQMLSGVDKMVSVEIIVGQATAPSKAQPGHGGDTKKEKQSNIESPSTLRQVSINLPNME
jgi:polyisoprenoid-binding protein YceI